MYNFVDRLMVCFAGLFFGSVSLGIIYFAGMAGYYMTGIPCEKSAQWLGVPGQYSISTGCMYQVQGQWVYSGDIVPVEKDGKIVLSTKYLNRQTHEVRVSQ